MQAIDETRENDRAVRQIAKRLASLTPREREVIDGIVEGKSSKIIAYELSTASVRSRIIALR